jgi:NADH dehydrogenase FAD-containing subunit
MILNHPRSPVHIRLPYRPLQVVISPKNYFLFTPLLPSVAVGTLNPRSIIQPTRYITRHKARTVSVIEAEATDVDVRFIRIMLKRAS